MLSNFTKIDEEFICENCGKHVPKLGYTCRNHCPYCFVSLHVDWDIPWDRNTDCWWKMYPISYELRNSTFKILFKCTKCGKQHRNKRSPEDEVTELNKFIDIYQKYF